MVFVQSTGGWQTVPMQLETVSTNLLALQLLMIGAQSIEVVFAQSAGEEGRHSAMELPVLQFSKVERLQLPIFCAETKPGATMDKSTKNFFMAGHSARRVPMRCSTGTIYARTGTCTVAISRRRWARWNTKATNNEE